MMNQAEDSKLRLNELTSQFGEDLVSSWVLVDQPRIDTFADCTEDHSPVHVDPQAAAAFLGSDRTVAHGMLSLSLLSGLSTSFLDRIEKRSCLNYGFDKVRFLAMVPEGGRVRAVYRLSEAVQRKPGLWRLRFESRLELEGAAQPAVIADWLLQMEDLARDPIE